MFSYFFVTAVREIKFFGAGINWELPKNVRGIQEKGWENRNF
jgi:hypothetical protein